MNRFWENAKLTLCVLWFAGLILGTHSAQAIMAGDESLFPLDAPSLRVDPLGANSAFHTVGALEVFFNGSRSLGSATALSSHWILTAAHNFDLTDQGSVPSFLSATFHLPGFGMFAAAEIVLHPVFSGFGRPSIHHDLALFRTNTPLPSHLSFPLLGHPLAVGDIVTLVGFGRSGYGSYGYTTQASTTNRRTGFNTIESLTPNTAGDGLLFRYSFASPDTLGHPDGSLGNELETIIAPGDSGGPVFLELPLGLAIVGVSTFTEGYGGRFGDIGGGIALDPYWDWISATTGLALIPETQTYALLLGLAITLSVLLVHRKNRFR